MACVFGVIIALVHNIKRRNAIGSLFTTKILLKASQILFYNLNLLYRDITDGY